MPGFFWWSHVALLAGIPYLAHVRVFLSNTTLFMNTSLRRSLGVFVLLVAVLSITLYSSYGIRDWFRVTFVLSEAVHARPTPPFELPGPDSSSTSFRFLAVGDAGTGGYGQQQVAESMGKKAARDPVSFVVLLGDNFYESGVSSVTDKQWMTKFDSVYTAPSLQIPFYAVLGNHDHKGNPEAQVDYTKHSPRWRMPSRYYTFVQNVDDSTDIQFFCIDTHPLAYLSPSDIAKGRDSATYRPQLRWLEQELSSSSARWKIVLGHHTLYSNGYHGDNPVLAALLEPLFEKSSVDIYLCGHDHDLQLLKPVKGVNYVVSGGGGKHRSVEWRDNTIYAATNLGFTSFWISHSEVTVEFLNKDGRVDYVHRFRKPAFPLPHQATETLN